MEKLRMLVNEIAYLSRDLSSELSPLQRSLIPFLSFASSVYRVSLFLRHHLYHLGLFRRHRLSVPVVSVGNLTWGGNGKTPMVEFIARILADNEISPLILTRGYAGGDEANMLRRHLIRTSAKIGVGANRAATAAFFLERHGYMDYSRTDCFEQQKRSHSDSDKIGAAIIDDGMQHISLHRDLEIVMVNGLAPWGNFQLLPLGPLREPLTALERADVAVVHHADLASEQNLKDIELIIRKAKESLPILFSRMSPSYFFNVGNITSKIPLGFICNRIVLCVSAIGFSNAFVQGVGKIGPSHVERLDFSDHYSYQAKDVESIRCRLAVLENEFGSKPVVVVTEKDYDRDPEILKCLDPFEVLVLCSHLQILPCKGHAEEGFKRMISERLLGVDLA